MNAIKSTEHYKERIKAELNNTLIETSMPGGGKISGKFEINMTLGKLLHSSQLIDKAPLTECWLPSHSKAKF